MKLVSSWIWTCVAVYISYDDNHYPTVTSEYLHSLVRVELLFINLSIEIHLEAVKTNLKGFNCKTDRYSRL